MYIMYQVQSVLLSKDGYTLKGAVDFCKIHGLKYKKIDETQRFYRFRQQDPNELRLMGFNRVITKKVSPYVEFIIYYK